MNWRNLAVAAATIGSVLLPADMARGESRDPDESELWTNIGIRVETPSGIDVTLTQNLRWNEGVSNLYLVAPEIALKYGAARWMHLETGYRYMAERDNDGLFQPRHRIFANARLRAKAGPAGFEFRTQWQEEFRDEQDDGTPRRQMLRLRAKAKLRSKGLFKPYASVESFRRLDGADPDIPEGTLTSLRWTLGVEWEWGTRELDLRYHFVSPQHDSEKAQRHVLSVGLRFDLEPWN